MTTFWASARFRGPLAEDSPPFDSIAAHLVGTGVLYQPKNQSFL